MKVLVVACVCFLQLGGVAQGANPNYSYHVKIDDPAYVNFQEKAETRKGEDAQGFYSVLEPNGALRTVSYTADERGFNPIVSYSYGHPQSSVSVSSASGPAAILHKPGVYAPAYVSDNRVQIVDKSNIYAAPPPALNFQAFALPGPSAPVIVPQPLRQVAPVVTAAAAITTNYAPAYVPPPRAYLPPPPQLQQQYLPVAAPPPPQVVSVATAYHPVPQPQVFAAPQPQVFAAPQPQVQLSLVDQPPAPVAFVQKFRPAKVLTLPAAAPAVKVVKTTPAIAIVKDSYSEAPRDTFRDPNAPSYPDAIKPVVVREPVAEYGPPAYSPPPVVSEAPVVKVRVVQPKAKVVQQVVQQQQVYLPPPPQAIAVQKVIAPQQQVVLNPGLYAGAIGYHTHTNQPDSYVHAYGTQGFQVTSSRKFNKGIIHVPQQQVIRAPPPVYGPPPAVAVQRFEQPTPVYGPPAVAIQKVQPPPVYGPPAIAVQKAVQPAPVYGPPAYQPGPPAYQPGPEYGPPPQVNVIHQQPQVHYQKQIVQAAPLPQLHQYVQAPPQAQIAVAAPLPPPPARLAVSSPVALATPTVALTGKKQNPLTFAYSYDQGGAKVSHSYSGSGW